MNNRFLSKNGFPRSKEIVVNIQKQNAQIKTMLCIVFGFNFIEKKPLMNMNTFTPIMLMLSRTINQKDDASNV